MPAATIDYLCDATDRPANSVRRGLRPAAGALSGSASSGPNVPSSLPLVSPTDAGPFGAASAADSRACSK